LAIFKSKLNEFVGIYQVDLRIFGLRCKSDRNIKPLRILLMAEEEVLFTVSFVSRLCP